ncbi:MAG: T9SS type A sorting domain-containing protein [Bacteroidota bacterium]
MKKFILIPVLLAFSTLARSQGVINDGAAIKITAGTVMYWGGTSNSFTNQAHGTSQGSVDLAGTMVISGNFTNNAANNVFIGANQTDGTVKFTGTATQTIGGTSAINFENVEINKSGGTATLNSTNNKVYGNMLINAGVFNASDKIFHVAGNWTNNGTFTSGTSSIIFDGTATQTVHSGGSSFSGITFNNTATGNTDINLNDNLSITSNATFTNGIVYYTNSAMMTFQNGATSNGGDSLSFVDGIVTKSGNNSFDFPIGDVAGVNVVWGPAAIASPAQSSTITAGYQFVAPANPTVICSGIDHASNAEQWNLTSNLSYPDVTLYWKNLTRSGLGNLADINLVNWEVCSGSNKWTEKGNAAIQDNAWQGHITGSFSSYGTMTLGAKCITPSITSSTPGSNCGTGTVILSAACSQGTVNWYTSSSGGSPVGSGSPWTTPSISTTTTYYAESDNNGCKSLSRTPVIATINPLPNATVSAIGGCGGSGTVTVTSDITGNQTFYLCDGSGNILNTATANASYYDFTSQPNGTYTGKVLFGNCTSVLSTAVVLSSATSTTWTGLVSIDWNTAGNWNCGIPSATVSATIPSGTPRQPTISNAAECKDLNILSGGILTISAGKSLTASGPTNLNGALCMVIKSDVSGTGSFIDNGSITGAGTAKVERYILANDWHYISKPVNTATASIFNGSYLKKWIESNYSWLNITSPSAALAIMEGYALKSLTTKVFSFTAKPNTGVLSIAVTRNTSQVSSKRGWNLVGNPYPSSIDWMAATGWTKTNVDNSIYIYNNNYANYAVYNGGTQLGVNGGSRYIAAEQGFFVTCSSSAGGTLGMNNSIRIHNNTPFLKSLASGDYVRLTLGHQGTTDEIIINVNADASNDFDGALDSYKIITPEIDQIWSVNFSDMTKQYAINSISDVASNPDIPVAFAPTANGTYTISASEFESLKLQTGIYLEDIKSGIITDLVENPSYSFTASTTDDINRFIIHFGKQQTTGIKAVDGNSELSLYPNPNNGRFIISLRDKLEGTATITVYDVLGHCVISKEVNGLVQEEFGLQNLASGVYTLKVIGARELPTIRFIVNQ